MGFRIKLAPDESLPSEIFEGIITFFKKGFYYLRHKTVSDFDPDKRFERVIARSSYIFRQWQGLSDFQQLTWENYNNTYLDYQSGFHAYIAFNEYWLNVEWPFLGLLRNPPDEYEERPWPAIYRFKYYPGIHKVYLTSPAFAYDNWDMVVEWKMNIHATPPAKRFFLKDYHHVISPSYPLLTFPEGGTGYGINLDVPEYNRLMFLHIYFYQISNEGIKGEDSPIFTQGMPYIIPT